MQKNIPVPLIHPVENVQAGFLFVSDDYHVKNWSFDFSGQTTKSKGYNDCFCFTMVRNGNFLFDVSKTMYSMHTGHIIVEKADFEFGLRPARGLCTIFNFSEGFYQQLLCDYHLEHSFFFSNKNLLSVLVQSNPETEYLHHLILRAAPTAGKLEMDNLVFELVNRVVQLITNTDVNIPLDDFLLKYHLSTVEKAKAYMTENFYKDIALKDIAASANISMFHFGRIFKKITQFTPNQYLTGVRLKHAELLLKNSSAQVKEVCYSSGFSNAEYFSSTFKKKYRISPVEFRLKNGIA
jgi:AraC family transcriptional regulator